MEPKNLGWKFAFVGLIVAMSIFAVYTKGLRQGIDLKGGHVLTFEVTGVEQERRDLEQKIAAGKERLAATADAAEKEALTKELNGYKERLADLADERDGNVVQEVVDKLKDRIDPNGLFSLEWRVERNRFTVRMPLGSDAAGKAKEAYEAAFAALVDDNIERSEIRRVALKDGDERVKDIKAICGDDAKRIEVLMALTKAHDVLGVASEALAKVRKEGRTGKARKDAQDAYDNATVDYETRLQTLLAMNINAEQLGRTLELYVTKAEAAKLPAKQTQKRRAAMARDLKELKEENKARVGMIEKVEGRYKDWVEQRSGLDDPADLIRLVAKMGVLEFRIAPTTPGSERQPSLNEQDYSKYMNELDERGPMPGRNRNDRYQWFPLRQKDEKIRSDAVAGVHGGKKYMLLCNASEQSMLQDRKRSWSLKKAYSMRGQMGRRVIGFQFDARGGARFATLTGNNKGRYLAILLDEEVYSSPHIQDRIANTGVITGDFSPREIKELVSILNAGALIGLVNPVPVSQKDIGPAIGADNRRAGKTAAIWGLIGVAVFMILYYWYAGLIANMALLLNLVLVLGAMSFIDAVFTLPGIAGIILTIGMAVDANVLIFERLREEQAKTQSMRMALRNAYSNAASAILDGNITTLLTCLILGWVGTREVRGFAITLSLGVMFSLFTALIVTRWVFQFLVERNWIRNRIRMAAFIGTPRINWMAKRRFFWILSAALVICGVLALVWQGSDILGLEFSSGTEAAFTFKRGVMIPGAGGEESVPNRKKIEDTIKTKAAEMAKQKREADAALSGSGQADIVAKSAKLLKEAADLEKLAGSAKVETILARNKTKQILTEFDADANGSITIEEWKSKGQDKFFRRLDANGDAKLSAEEIDSGMPEWTYQVSTTLANVGAVQGVLTAAFRDQLDLRPSVTIAGDRPQESGFVPALMIDLNADDKGRTLITQEFVEKRVNTDYRAQLFDYIGGVMFVLGDLSPPRTEADIRLAIKETQDRPDYQELKYNRFGVIGLEPAEGAGRQFKSVAVLYRNQNIDYSAGGAAAKKSIEEGRKLVLDSLASGESLGTATVYDPSFAGQTAQAAIAAFVLSWLAIIVYLWVRFGSARWGLAAVICLVHDVIIAVGMVAITAFIYNTAIGRMLAIGQFKINMPMVAAFLTIVGYSVNDTIVIFDRIRENRGKLTTVDERTINRSINQTISRTLLTTTTTLIAVGVMYTMGGAGIHAFTYALLVGIIVGTYSSVAVASPLLLGFKHAIIGKAMKGPEAVADK